MYHKRNDTRLRTRRRTSRRLSSRRKTWFGVKRRGASSRHATGCWRTDAERGNSYVATLTRFPYKAKMSLGKPHAAVLANWRQASRRWSPWRRHKKANQAKTCMGTPYDPTLESRRPALRRLSSPRPNKIRIKRWLASVRHTTQRWKFDSERRDNRSREDESREARRHDTLDSTPSVTMLTQHYELSEEKPREAKRHDAENSTPSMER
jgi:hypothetical protein